MTALLTAYISLYGCGYSALRAVANRRFPTGTTSSALLFQLLGQLQKCRSDVSRRETDLIKRVQPSVGPRSLEPIAMGTKQLHQMAGHPQALFLRYSALVSPWRKALGCGLKTPASSETLTISSTHFLIPE